MADVYSLTIPGEETISCTIPASIEQVIQATIPTAAQAHNDLVSIDLNTQTASFSGYINDSYSVSVLGSTPLVVSTAQDVVVAVTLTGPPGPASTVPGPQGPQGNTGPQGIQGPPGASALEPIVFTQSLPAATWTITHNLGTKPLISILDSTNSIVYGDIAYPDNNTAVITFGSPFSGTAYLL